MDKREIQCFKALFISSFFAFGLFYESIACIYCGAFGCLYAVMAIRRKKLVFYRNLQSVTICVIVLMYLLTCIYGVDAGMGWIGFLKNLTILFFLCCAMQLTEKERESMLAYIPMIGSVMTLTGIVAYGISPIREIFYTADRLGSFFQYANVFALFCLMGLILLTGEESGKGRNKWLQILQTGLLILGIFLSGSRTVMLLMLAVCVVQGIRKKEWRIPIAIILILMFAAAGIYVAATGNMQNLGRFLTTSLGSSTFLGRILYVKDGIRLILRHPFGLGYLGYYFMEPQIQTGIYSVRYIHNDVLQMALDVGVIPAILFLWMLGRNIFGRGGKFEKRLLVAVIGLHCLVDFDLEFTSIWFILILAMNLYRGREINIAAGEKTAFYKIIALLLSVGSLYTGLAMIPRYLGNPGMTVSLLPFYTEAKTELLEREEDSGKAEELAESLLKQNSYLAEAYDTLSVVAYQNRDYRQMAEYKQKSIENRKYYIEGYERYVIMLSQAIADANVQGNMELMQELMQKVPEVQEQLEEVEKTTDDISYRIKDRPEFTLEGEVADYIEQVERLLEE